MDASLFSLGRRAARMLTATASVTGLIFGMQGTAYAQETDNSGGIDEIVVTAQKRAQNVQDIPIAVTALSQDTLKINRVSNIMDLNGLAPGLQARQNAGSTGAPSYTLRGVFATASVPAQDRQISTYIDGVYIGGVRGVVSDLPDIERVEVLRGPQGTLFGRNATAGAVSIITRDPKGELALHQEITFGNYNQLKTRTTIDTPQMGIFSAYVTYVHDERRGDTRNLGAGTTWDRTKSVTGIGVLTSPKWLGSKNADNIFAAIKLKPSEDFSIIYKFDRSRNENTPEARAATVNNTADGTGALLTAIAALQPVGGGVFGPVILNPSNKRPKVVNNAWTVPGYVHTMGHNLTINWQASDNLSFKNTASYRKGSSIGLTSLMGFDGLEITAAVAAARSLPANTIGQMFGSYEANNFGKNWQVSNELQANYNSELLTLTVGGIYFHNKEVSSGVPNMRGNFAFTPVGTVLTLGNVQETHHATTSIAAYAQGEFHLTPQLDLVVGSRITKDRKKNEFVSGGTYSTTLNAITGESHFFNYYKKTKPSFSIGVNYKVNDDILVYGKFSTAFLAGGTSGPLSFSPETVQSWEAGLKSEWFDRKLRFNMALWQATYKHAQSAQSGSNVRDPRDPTKTLSAFSVVVVDNGTVKSKGVEVELTAAPAAGLTFGGSLGYTDTKWLNPSTGVTQGLPYKPSSLPKVIGGVNAQYTTPPLFGDATLTFRIDGLYQSSYRANPILSFGTTWPQLAPYLKVQSRWLANGRVALRDVAVGPAKVEIGVWARNLFDNKDPVYALLFGSINHNASFQPARTIGLDAIFDF